MLTGCYREEKEREREKEERERIASGSPALRRRGSIGEVIELGQSYSRPRRGAVASEVVEGGGIGKGECEAISSPSRFDAM